MSHTPRPWFVEGVGGIQMDGIRDGYMIHSESQRKIASLYGGTTMPRDERYPNANLIAAAPDLLAALEGLKAKYEKVCEDFVYQHCDHETNPRNDLPWAAAADAIAKARGES